MFVGVGLFIGSAHNIQDIAQGRRLGVGLGRGRTPRTWFDITSWIFLEPKRLQVYFDAYKGRKKRDHSDSALRQGESCPDSDSGSRSRSLPKFSGNSLSKNTSTAKIFTKIRSVFPEIWTKLWKMPYLAYVREFFRKFLYPDPNVDKFQNLNSSFLSRGTSVVKFPRRYFR